MGNDNGNKRARVDDRDRPGNKKSKGNGWRKGNGYSLTGIEPGMQGIFVTCDRGKESKAMGEFTEHLEEAANDLYHLDEAAEEEASDEEEDIAAALAKEIQSLKPKKHQDRKIAAAKLDSQCVVFFRLKHPLDPTAIVEHLCKSAVAPNFRNTRTISRLTPVTRTGKATMEGLKEVATQVLAPHFHSGQKGVKFAIRVTSRHHNTLGRLDIINEVARTVGPDHNVDLKKYDVLILIEVYKNICGMSVVKDFEKYRRFNMRELQASGLLDETATTEKKVDAPEATTAVEPQIQAKTEEPKVEAKADEPQSAPAETQPAAVEAAPVESTSA